MVEFKKWVNRFIFFVIPSLLAIFLLLLYGGKSLVGEIIQRQFVNTYISYIGLIIFLIVFVFVYIKARLNEDNISMSIHPGRLFLLFLLNMLLGLFLLQTTILSHSWFSWSFLTRFWIMFVNLLISFVPSFLLLIKKVDFKTKRWFLFTLLLWGYVVASEFRMLPFIIGIE